MAIKPVCQQSYARHKIADNDVSPDAGNPHIRKTLLRAAFQKQKNHYP
ncbi:hypothetical protein AC26_0860 [Escherichia coli 1-176-05_S3_C2]|nr:hypothetical protein AC26_0860 [Escherichia coli 1-176-05_S3_C2]